MPRIDLEGLPDKEPVAVVAAPSGIDYEALPDKEVSKGLTSPERLPRWKDIKDKIPANMEDYEQDAKDAISVAATYDLDMDQAYSLQGNIKEELDQPNLWDQAQASFKAGMGDVYVGMGNTLKWAGMDEEFSDVYVDFGERMRDAYIPAADQSEFSWRKTIDPEWWATTVTRSVPFTLSLIPAAIVGAYAGAAGAGAVGLGTFGTTVVTALGGAAASRPLESAFEAAAAYETALARGDSEEDASSAADKVFASNMALVGLDATQFALAFTPLKFGKVLKPSLLRRMSAGTGKLSAVAISEAGEERYQEYIQMEALGEESNFFDLDNPRLNEASAIGGIFGAGMGGVGSVWTGLTKKTTEAMPEDVQKLYNDVRAQSLSGGADEAQATRDALDAVADTPEGKEHIETVLNDMKETASKEMPVEGAPEISAPTIEELFEKLKTEDLTEEELGGLLDQFAGGREIIEEVQAEPVAEIRERLLATGMDEAEATANAALFDGFRVLAQRAGVSVDDLMERYLPEVSREGAEEVAAPEVAQVVTEEERRAITDNPFLSDQITTEEQLADAESLRAARERINETLVEQKEEQTVSDEEMLQLGEAVDFLDAKIKTGVVPVERPEVPMTQPTQEGIVADEPRARIRFAPEGISVDLLKKADESSFVHETGHIYFRMMADLSALDTASEELKTDFETLKTWLNYEEGQVGFTVDQQEQFARGFEAYLREGKAPSSALAAAFENFKQWLMQIYKSLRELNVELTDEVRGVMDRMLADEGVEIEPAPGREDLQRPEVDAVRQPFEAGPEPSDVTEEEFYQDQTPAVPRLSAIHNLTADNLRFADELGGFAVPSIAVVPEDVGVKGYGELTLIGRKNLADPSFVPVFDADAYTSTFPKPEYKKAKVKDAQALVDEFRPIAQEFGDRFLVDEVWDNSVNRAKPDEVANRIINSEGGQAAYLRSIGKEVKPKIIKAGLEVTFVEMPSFKKFVKKEGLSSDFEVHDDYHKKMSDAARQAIEEDFDKKVKKSPSVEEHRDLFVGRRIKNFFDDEGFLYLGKQHSILGSVRAIGTKEVDRVATGKRMRKLLKGHEADFHKWVEEKVYPMFGDPFVTISRRKEPYTLDNIVRVMIATGVQAKEQTLTFGEGLTRAVASKQFRSLEQMRNAAISIVDEDIINEERERAKELMEEYRAEVIKHYTHKDWRGDINTWDALDDSMKAIARWAKTKGRTEADLGRILNSMGFEDVPSKTVEIAATAGRALLNAPVPYFEAKPRRAVALEEFAGAVVPNDVNDSTIDILKRHNIPFEKYGARYDEEARLKKVNKMRTKLKEEVLFQAAPARITNIRQLAKSLGGIDYNREHMKGELDKLKEDAPATKLVINKRGDGVTLDQLREAAIEAGILTEEATLDDVLSALEVNLETAEVIEEEFAKEERVRRRAETKAYQTDELRKEFIELSVKARKAYREGKDYGAVKEARKLKNILARTRKIRLVRDYFNLTDADLKKISRKNPLLLSQYEFKLYIDDVRIKAAQLSEDQLQKALLINMIYVKDLAKVDNYRRVLGLPPISQMTTDQVKEFARALEPFHDGDVFLSERELETVDRTDLEGIKTWREAKERLAAEIGVSIEELETIKVTEWDEYKWDTALAEANPFYKMLVTETTRKLLEADLRFHEIENELFDLARKSEKSRNRTFVEKAIPQDKQIMTYLETPSDERGPVAETMTPEQIDLANYMEQYFQIALEYLVKTKSLDRGRQNYFVHMRRSFLENVKEEGLVKAFKDMFKSYQEDEAVFNIMDEDTGNILPLEKFFQFSMQRTGGIDPTTNVTKAFLVYAQMMEKKISLDELIPKMDIYAQSITPAIYTPRGLEVDRSIKKFVNKYINNRKGRRIRWISKQGGTIDVATRGARSLTTLIDLGFNIPSGVAAFVGEQATNFGMLGISGYAKGNARIKTKKGKAILRKYEAFIGRSSWENFTAPGKELTERIYDGLFGLFHEASVLANKQFLLGAITDDEYNKGELTSERLAILKVEMGRLRVVPGTKSMVGSTSAGSAMMQYKTWAAPIISTLTRDIKTLVNDLAKKKTGEALTTKEAREIYRVIGLTTTALIVGAMASAEDDDETFTGQVLKRVYRESMTLIQGVDPSLWLATPRLMGFMTQLGKNLKAIATLEEYKTKPGLVGVEGLQKQLTPRAFKQFDEPKKKERL